MNTVLSCLTNSHIFLISHKIPPPLKNIIANVSCSYEGMRGFGSSSRFGFLYRSIVVSLYRFLVLASGNIFDCH